MKKIISILVLVLALAINANAQQEVKTIALEQTKGEFTQKSLKVSEGTYVFKVSNNHVGRDVGLVLVPKGKDASKPENHITSAYVTQVVKDGKVENSKPTVLKKGEYVYFCPLNPTPQYRLIVE
ncbi:cupredoxin domain-containing protein [Aestuariivivens insulae]|uniref:cupredoxin domain-containing protein n=1 Tax=Aestuariivivens insulae TaxID=1621988 RepID=UPI001F58100E|nr:cupredoxin domain-containing protein [Aestuariivivens insulae]